MRFLVAGVVFCIACFAAAGAVASSTVKTPPPPLLNLARIYGHPAGKPNVIRYAGYRFRCWTFVARNGLISECVLLGHATRRPVAPSAKPTVPGA